MKKTLLSIATVVAVITSANAQDMLSKSKFFDNWQVGVKGGGFSWTTREAFIKNTRATFGAEIGKQISPAFRLGVEGMAYVRPVQFDDDPEFGNFVDMSNVSLVGTVNLSNLIAGYKGTPRFFEVEGFAGLGWAHIYPQGADNRKAPNVLNTMTAEFGSNLLFNLGQSKAWGIKISPALVYGVDGVENRAESVSSNELNLKNSWTQVTAGVVYRFKGSNGAHHFTTATQNPDNSAELGRLRDELNSKNKELSDCQRQVNKLQDDLEAARNKKPEVVEKVVTKNKKTLESVVTFRVAKSTIDASQLPNVERIASYLNKYSNAKVSIKGYASPEGNLEKNKQLATARAEAVKNLLVKRYKISADRIQAEGNGIGDMFSEPDWNRVSIANIVE
ncbi:OmpA family protein [Capnocytophaga sp. oral taxon 412 str. F0487]|uniref:OmpA family protein n=1 Tax=Capnocytophaga sp. oral taxon 412 TaxID=712218 RepID=UPI0002696279|nr:OmpA family protein [Capnocytophaga sp. oral taxon 412]EIW92033.1 OmpA family protein [Capnocytophaga sp. oral taxon 412 str. F0487]